MKKLLFVLVPLVLFAQVEIDTVMRLPVRLGQALFIPELNRLYTMSSYGGSDLFVLDCSTYTLKAQIPIGVAGGRTHFSWNSLRQKLYLASNPNIKWTLVIDAAADSVIDTLTVPHEWYNDVYLSDIDVRFKPVQDSLYEYECAADTVIRRLPIHSTCASWDSVGQKLYVGEGSRRKLYVYDYLADSCIKEIDVSAVATDMPDAVAFNHNHHRGYVGRFAGGPFSGNVGIIDTERDTLLRTLAVRIWNGLHSQVAVNERDGKVYIADSDARSTTPDTLWVVDCATDSVLKKLECVPRGHAYSCIRWVPWSNRIYLVNIYPDGIHNSSLVVIDCNTDSVLVPGMLLNDMYIRDIQLDPVRERIFVIGVDSTDVYVLRDVEGGVVEEPASAGPGVAPGLRVQMTPSGFELRYSVPSPCRVDLSVHDQMGRGVKQLVAAEQSAGEHCVSWDCRDSTGTLVPRGVYFCRLTAGSASSAEPTAVAKIVVTR